MKNISLLISTCDKFSDLWDQHIIQLRKHWKGEMFPVYMVTDKKTPKRYDGVEIIVAGEEKDFPMRIKYAIEQIPTEFILLTLDDYFLINDVYSKKLDYLAQLAKEKNIFYLKLYDRRMTNPKKYEAIDNLIPIDLNRKYAITLYPAIWDKRFLFNSVKKDMTPWKYEPSLTYYAKQENAVCMFCHAGVFNILDVVRKGKVLHKADIYFKRNNISIGDRPKISWWIEIKLFIMDIISWYMPRSIFRAGKRLLKYFGKTFYSED